MKNVVIARPERIGKTIRGIAAQGASKFHVLSDFDKTLTYAFVDGQKRPSLISVLRDENYLTPDYAKKAHALFDTYYPIEVDPKIALEEKKKLMEEWWEKHFELLIQSRLNKKDLERVVRSKKLRLRDGALAFIDFLHQKKVPLVILSSTGLGGDAISLYLQNVGRLYDNVFIISNFLQWDDSGNAIGYQKPIIHSLNKNEMGIEKFPHIYKKIKDRKNVLLLGDSVNDIGMVQGFHYENVIKVRFLNEDVKEQLDLYQSFYDVILINDSSMDYINMIIKEIII